MISPRISVLRTGLVTSVGLTAAASCAAIRAKVRNPGETRFIDSAGEWIMGHRVDLESPWAGRQKLAKMAALAIEEALADIPREDWGSIPLILCVAETSRPGRLEGLDEVLFAELKIELGTEFAEQSRTIPQGRVSIATALLFARRLVAEVGVPRVLIAATDSFLTWPTLCVYDRLERLQTPRNSNGFMPGEGAGALLVGNDAATEQGLKICGLGFAREAATLEADQPLRAEGLVKAIRDALLDAGCGFQDLDFRITDLSGEQYYFKEAALALLRVLRVRKEEFDIWHPAECIGESGSLSGLAALVVADASCREAYAPGPGILCHVANDGGERAALVLRYQAD